MKMVSCYVNDGQMESKQKTFLSIFFLRLKDMTLRFLFDKAYMPPTWFGSYPFIF